MEKIKINKILYTDSQLYADVKNIKQIREDAKNDNGDHGWAAGWLSGEELIGKPTPMIRLDDNILSVIQAYYEGKTITVQDY